MRAIAVIAGGVFRDSIRDRIAYSLVFFAVLLIAASVLLAQLTAGQDVKIIKDLGLAASSAIGVLIGIFYGISLVAKEVERRSIYSLLSKPVTRAQFVAGKYLGLALTLLANLAVMAVAMYAVLAYMDRITLPELKLAWEAPALDPQLLKAFALIGVELMVVTAIALFFSTFSSPFLSTSCALALYVIGHFGGDLKQLESIVASPVLAVVGRVVYYALPNLAALDVKAQVVHGVDVSVQHMALATLSSGLYIGALLAGAAWIFSRRDLKSMVRAFVLAALLSGAIGSQVAFDDELSRRPDVPPVVWLQSPELTRRLALGFENVLADVYWIRAVQYYGSAKLSAAEKKDYGLLYPLLDMTTTLDPRFNIAYRFGAILLSEGYPNGPGNPDQAIALLKKGMREMPEKWQYYHDAGFVEYWWRQDYRAAADWMLEASKQPDAPNWLVTISATMLAKGGDRASARTLWSQLAQTAEQEWLRSAGRRALLQLDAEDAIDLLEPRVHRFFDMNGRFPDSWNELVRAGLLRGIPLDPTGVPYALDAVTGTVDVAKESTLYPLRREKATAGAAR